jgi:hypothetical protein
MNLKIDMEDISRRESALSTILDDMTIPLMRREVTLIQNLRWLNRNLAVQNSSHPMALSALELIRFLIKHNNIKA